MKSKTQYQNPILLMNWLFEKELFRFSKVKIVQATDEEVERFAVQVGNDTNSKRQQRYKKMACVVSCPLSLNTIRILEHTFGQVKIQV